MTNEGDSRPGEANAEQVPGDMIHSLRALSRRLNVHASTVSGWISRGCPGPSADGFYDLQAVELWLAARVTQKLETGAIAEDYAALVKARADEREHLARIAEVELETLRSQYLPISLVRRRASWQQRIVRRELEGMIDRLVPRLVAAPNEYRARIAYREEARACLERIMSAKA